MAWFCESFAISVVGLAIVPFFVYLVGACWLFIFIADDIKEDLRAFNSNEITIEHATKTNKANDNQHVKLMNRFCAIVQLYTDAKV